MTLTLGYEEVRQAITMADAVSAIEDACREQAAGQALVADRLNLHLPNGWIRLMPGALLSSSVFGYKEFHLSSGSVRYAFHLFDLASGEPLAIMDANYLTAIRTGAAAGAATRYMAPADARVLGVIGSGAEARTQVEAVVAVRPVERVRVYSRSAERRQSFATAVKETLGIEAEPVESPQDAIEGADILVAATNTGSSGPALFGKWLRPGLHLNSIGSTLPSQREIDPEVWSFADRIVLDTRKLLEECGDGIAAVQAGAVDERKIVELQDVVSGKAPGRAAPGETTLYKSVGTGLQDVAVAARVYQRAKARGVGRFVEAFQSVKQLGG